MSKVAVLIDGGHLRVLCRLAQKAYSPDYVELIAHACVQAPDEELLRVLYYDCAPFNGDIALPVSGQIKTFDQQETWLRNLAPRLAAARCRQCRARIRPRADSRRRLLARDLP